MSRELLQRALEALYLDENVSEVVDAIREELAKPESKLDSTRTASVSTNVYWIPLTQAVPVAVKMLLIAEDDGVAHCRTHFANDGFTHYHPLPRFRND